jgi:hypothetical protein
VHFLSLLEVSLKKAFEGNFASFVLIKRLSIVANLKMWKKVENWIVVSKHHALRQFD